MNNWIAKHESYVNPRTAQVMRQRINNIYEARKKAEADVEFVKQEGETEIEKLIRVYSIKVKEPEMNCGPQVVELCTKDTAYGFYKQRPNIGKIIADGAP